MRRRGVWQRYAGVGAVVLGLLGAACAPAPQEAPEPAAAPPPVEGLEGTRWGMTEAEILASFGGEVKQRIQKGERTVTLYVERNGERFGFRFDDAERMEGFSRFVDEPSPLSRAVAAVRAQLGVDPTEDRSGTNVEAIFEPGGLEVRISCYPASPDEKTADDPQCARLAYYYRVTG